MKSIRWSHVATEHFVPESTSIVSYNEDARTAIPKLAHRSYDFVFGGAFNDSSMPCHLTIVQFARSVASPMATGGIYVSDIIN